jgi:hypothetical protein
MEWVLQFVDEIDDALSMLRHGWLGLQVRLWSGRTPLSPKAEPNA